MKVVYILNGTSLCGGVKVVYEHVAILRSLGVDAEVVSTTPPSDWHPESRAFYRRLPELTGALVGEADVAVGTIFFTVPVALAVPGAAPFHLCQGYEGIYDPAREHWPWIEETYALPTRKLVVSPHLAGLVAERFGQTADWIPQPFDGSAFPARTGPRVPDGTFRVLLTGQWGVPVKGLAWAFEALRPLADGMPGLKLVRLSQDAPPEEVAAWPEAERHVLVPPAEVPALYRSVDLFVGASTEGEGFGLPTLEAMASGLPTVLTDIGASRGIDPSARASLRVPFGDSEALRDAVRRVASDPGLSESLGREGRAIADTFTRKRTGEALLKAFEDELARRASGGRRGASHHNVLERQGP